MKLTPIYYWDFCPLITANLFYFSKTLELVFFLVHTEL